ncbi:MAG: flagellar biosynthetic protein FliO [Desulfovibrio sp.]|jgi:flagellar protein FliO/FliZ|nr:flagellar biosynthetic protein FliO [Desulfovibrio sp.]
MQTAAQNATASAARSAADAAWSWSGYFEALALICFLLALLWLLTRFLVKRGGAPGLLTSGRGLHVESRLPLGPKKWILLLRCLDRRLLIGVTDHAVTVLAELDAENGAAPEPSRRSGRPCNDEAGEGTPEEAGLFARLLKKAGAGGQSDD